MFYEIKRNTQYTIRCYSVLLILTFIFIVTLLYLNRLYGETNIARLRFNKIVRIVSQLFFRSMKFKCCVTYELQTVFAIFEGTVK